MATKTFEELKQLAIQIRDEKTNKQNTATRVGTAMLEHINKLEQDYYDKTQTDEELKERDDKLTEKISDNTNDIESERYKSLYYNTLKIEKYSENVTLEGFVNSTPAYYTVNTFNITDKILGVRVIDDCDMRIATIDNINSMSDDCLSESIYKLRKGLNFFDSPIQLNNNQYLAFSKNVRLLVDTHVKLYEISTNKITSGFTICASIIIDANNNINDKINIIESDIRDLKNKQNLYSYVGYNNIDKITGKINVGSSVYYNNIQNGVYIGVRIKINGDGPINIHKVTANPIGSTEAKSELIYTYNSNINEDGLVKDIFFPEEILLNNNEYLGISGCIYFGPLDGHNMYLVTSDSSAAITLNYIVALNGILKGDNIRNTLKECIDDINNINIKLDNADINNSLYIELQHDNLKSDNGNFTVQNWEYTDNGIKPSAIGSDNYIMNNKVYHSDKRFMRVHAIMGTDTKLKIPVVWGGINAGEGASCFAVDFVNKKLIIYSVGNGQDSQDTSSGYNNSELVTEAIPDEMIGNREYVLELHKDGTNHILRLLDTLTGESCEVSHDGWGAGRQNQYYAFYCESGTLPTLNNFQVFSLNRPDVVFVGDSITEGVMVTDRTKRYAEQFRKNNPDKKVVISARGGDSINGVLAKFATEYNIYKPKIMSVLIGANGGNTLENLTQLKTNCEAIGCTLILHRRTCQQSTDIHTEGNELIEQIGVNGARFDIATAKDNYPYVDETHTSPRYNESLYYDAGLHPNNEGDTKMYKRLLIDTPEMFYM